ncbi:ribosomal protein S18-alanine N-acetyltransferase [Dialister micraerophilus]|uniref:ribosomal protein S18-alanine N-acetyltransferase n=1 Tax=Dialister micraerophilus TaxID=309120 RepID=UPI0023F0C58B|nr:ribosomal protein S18-alanine N-acetyltransferase [Dialister micraerophilus]
MGKETQSEIKIRKALKKDVNAIYEIGKHSFFDAWRKETVESDLVKSHSCYFVAEFEGRIIGYACYWFILDEAQLVNLAVEPEYRRKGTAKALMNAGETEAVNRNMRFIFLEVRVGNINAQELYRKMGFIVGSLRKGVYENPKEDGYIMMKKLTDPMGRKL